MMDFTGLKISQVKAKVREQMMADFMEFLKAKYDAVEAKDNGNGYYEGTIGQVGTNEIALVVGEWTDDDGYSHEVPVVIKATAKPFYDSIGTKGRITEPYNVADEVQAYEEEQKAKQASKVVARARKEKEKKSSD